MKVCSLPVSPDEFLSRLRFATEIDTVEKNQTSEKEAIFYCHTTENTFNLYERPAFTREKTFYFGGMLLRGAVCETEQGCQIATEYGRSSVNVKTVVSTLILLVVCSVVIWLSGNLFATILPIPAAIALGFLVVDGVHCAIQIKRLRKKWDVILAAIVSDPIARKELL